MHDAHIHLAMEPLKSNLSEIVERFLGAGGKHILTQGTDMTDFQDTLEISQNYRAVINIALGLHPTTFEESALQGPNYTNITERSQKIYSQFEEIFIKNLPKLTAIGETGLDYYQMSLNKEISEDVRGELKEIQKNSFSKHLQLALDNKLPLSIHARDINGNDDCVKDVLKLVAQKGRGLLKGCFHSYTGDIKHLDQILDIGFHVGFNGIITYKSGGDVRDILKKTPVDRILFETDGPFLPPQSVRKNKKIREKFAQPFDIKEIIKVAAEVKDISPDILERETDINYEKVFLNK